jgi:hypothetical protein
MAAGGGQLPEIAANGQVSMTIHQINGSVSLLSRLTNLMRFSAMEPDLTLGPSPGICLRSTDLANSGVSLDATGATYVPMTIVTQVPGEDSRSDAEAQDFPLVAAMCVAFAAETILLREGKRPAGVQCTGGPNGNACMVRCQNDANAGPFGACAVIIRERFATPSSSFP